MGLTWHERAACKGCEAGRIQQPFPSPPSFETPGMHVRFLVNPSAGGSAGRRALPAIRAGLPKGARLVVSRDAAHLAAEARRAVDEGVERLVVAGGDGTFHLVLPPLVGARTCLGLVPVGRGNDFAVSLGRAGRDARGGAAGADGPAAADRRRPGRREPLRLLRRRRLRQRGHGHRRRAVAPGARLADLRPGDGAHAGAVPAADGAGWSGRAAGSRAR